MKRSREEKEFVPFIDHARNNRVAEILQMLRDGLVSPNVQDSKGRTALMVASKYTNTTSSPKIVEVLLSDPRTDPNIQDIEGKTALIISVEYGNVDAVHALLSDPRTDPNIKDTKKFYGFSALHANVYKIVDFIENAEEIIENAEDYDIAKDLKIFQALLADPRTDPNITDERGDTNLIILTYELRDDRPMFFQMFQALLAHPRTDPNIQSKGGVTGSALHVLTEGYANYAVRALLADPRTDPNIQNEYGNTALNIAASFVELETVQDLLADPRTDPNIKDRRGMTALMNAVESIPKNEINAMKIIRLLLNDPRVEIGNAYFLCPTRKCKELFHYKMMSKKISGPRWMSVKGETKELPQLPPDIWGYILKKKLHKELCHDLKTNSNFKSILNLANSLQIPKEEMEKFQRMSKKDLCEQIARILAVGAIWSNEGMKYLERKERVQPVYQIAHDFEKALKNVGITDIKGKSIAELLENLRETMME